jgi:hypothetical protein
LLQAIGDQIRCGHGHLLIRIQCPQHQEQQESTKPPLYSGGVGGVLCTRHHRNPPKPP